MGRIDELLWRFGPERFRTAVVRNLAHPRGRLGRRIGGNLVEGSALLNARTVELLAPVDGEVLLEVGHGPGAAFAQILAVAPRATVIGADPSEAMIEAATARNRDAVAAGRVTLHNATTEDLPLANASVDAAFGINVVYFWRDPALALGELRRVLRPSGRLAIGYRPRAIARPDIRDRFDLAGHQIYAVEQIEAMLLAAGFRTPTTTLAEGGEAVTIALAPPAPAGTTPEASGSSAPFNDPGPDLELPTFVVE